MPRAMRLSTVISIFSTSSSVMSPLNLPHSFELHQQVILDLRFYRQ